jgi:Family of unknown function (DUF6184)
MGPLRERAFAHLPAVMLLAACAVPASRDPSSAPPPAPLDASTAANQVAETRCSHEAACGHVGPNGQYSSLDACTQDYARSALQDIGPPACSGTIDAAQLGRCLAELKGESCHPLDLGRRILACRTAALCLRAPNGSGDSFTASDVYGP